jgi:predicted DNA-binding mobile mystery protein A
VKTNKSAVRRQLDQRLAGLEERIGTFPLCGWVRAIRLTLGMSTPELAERMAISQSRASRLERAEVEGSIRLSTLRRAAEALNCRLLYVFVPDEPLDQMVRGQARRKAAEELSRSASDLPLASDRALVAEALAEQLEALTVQLVDSQGLWLRSRPSPPTPLEP